jgi:hypothetical protein
MKTRSGLIHSDVIVRGVIVCRGPMGPELARAHDPLPWPRETPARSRGLIGLLTHAGESDLSVGSDPVCEANQRLNLVKAAAGEGAAAETEQAFHVYGPPSWSGRGTPSPPLMRSLMQGTKKNTSSGNIFSLSGCLRLAGLAPARLSIAGERTRPLQDRGELLWIVSSAGPLTRKRVVCRPPNGVEDRTRGGSWGAWRCCPDAEPPVWTDLDFNPVTPPTAIREAGERHVRASAPSQSPN